MKQATFELVERIKNEASRLAMAAGGEGNNTTIFQYLQHLEEGLRHLTVAAQWGADAHPFVSENLSEAERLLGIKYQ
jgi:cation transport regulator ChaC